MVSLKICEYLFGAWTAFSSNIQPLTVPAVNIFVSVNEILLHWLLPRSFVVGSSLLSLIRRISSFRKDSSSLKQTQQQKNVTIRLRNDLSFFSFWSFLTLFFLVSFFSSCRDFCLKSLTFFVLVTVFIFSFCLFDFFLLFLSSVAWHWLSKVTIY